MNIRYPIYEGVYRILTLYVLKIMVKSVRAKVAEKAENTPMPCYLQRYHLFPNRAQKLSLNDIRHIRLA